MLNVECHLSTFKSSLYIKKNQLTIGQNLISAVLNSSDQFPVLLINFEVRLQQTYVLSFI